MGLGDVLMSIGEAKRVHRTWHQPVLIANAAGQPVRSDLFNGVPYLITRPQRIRYQRLVNCPGHRPYIRAKLDNRWVWNKYQPEPADIVFTEQERAFAERYRGHVMVEPNVKDIGHRNKDWGWRHWAALHGFDFIQCYREGDRLLPGARHVLTTSFRQTLAVLAASRAYVGAEGGLHHGAAAVGVSAVVLFGGFISPAQTGYLTHVNLFTGGEPCGSRVDCEHCRKAMSAITPEMVAHELKGLLT